MLPKNRTLLKNFYIVLFLLYILILGIAYTQFRSYAISQNEYKLQDLLMHDKALQKYIENNSKPVFYNFQNKGILPKSYFNPVVLSFTYISRHVMQYYNELRKNHHLEPIIYKIASDNPRNPINTASKEELKILNAFNKNIIKTYEKYYEINGKPYIYYAIPVARNKNSCMKCHSTPDKAPAELIKMYGKIRGFHEKIGHIRAILSIKMPLQREFRNANHLFIIFAGTITLIFILIFLIIFYFIKKLDKNDKTLIYQLNHDTLTKVYNRTKFNKDIQTLINSKRDEDISIIMFDIDHFKKINDTYGHPVGDKILSELTKLISENIRAHDKLYRIGGEEFIIISTNTNIEKAYKFAEKLRKLVENHTFFKNLHITISLGIAQLKKDEWKEFYKKIDNALYKAKESGRNKTIII